MKLHPVGMDLLLVPYKRLTGTHVIIGFTVVREKRGGKKRGRGGDEDKKTRALPAFGGNISRPDVSQF